MSFRLPAPDQLPFTADHYQWRGKPAALIPGRCAVVYDPGPRSMPWSELVKHGKLISSREFRNLLHTLE